MARLMMRAPLVASRLVTTADPLGSRVPYAKARRMAISGVMSTFNRPDTPSSPNSPRAPPDCQMIDFETMAPGSTDLNG